MQPILVTRGLVALGLASLLLACSSKPRSGPGTSGGGAGGATDTGAGGAGGSGTAGTVGAGAIAPGCDPLGAAAAPPATTATTAAPACASNPADYAYPFLDPCLPTEDRITNLLSLLTPAEKQTLLAPNHAAIPRLNLPAFALASEGLHGVGWSGNPATSTGTLYLTGTQFPQAFGLGETWDPEVTKIVGETTGQELRVYSARGVSAVGRGTGLVMRAPNVDLARDPRWGRTEESYGEDPFLIGELSKGFLAGLHGPDPKYLLAASMLKHFAANSNETTRLTSSSNLDDRNLREYYAATFETAVRAGRADAIMTAYNQINGVPAAVTPLLRSMVMGDWKFDGLFSTDGSAPTILLENQHYFPTLKEAIAAIIKGGTAVILQQQLIVSVNAAYADGLITEADIDEALRSVFRVRIRLGDLDPPAYVPYKAILGTDDPWNTDASKARALDVTRKTIVLLKNQNRALPLDRTQIGSVAVIGPRADSVIRDWYGGTPPYVVTPRQGIATKLGAGVTVNFAADDTGGAAAAAAAMSDVALVFVGNHPTCGLPYPPWGTCPSQYDGREQVDRTFLALEPAQLALVQSVAQANPLTIVVLVSSFPTGIGPIDAAANVPAIVHVTNSGQELGTAIADVLFGDYNPGGHTTTTWYQSEADIPTAITDYDIRQGTTYWYYAGTPLYPFGYGLSYSTFTYSNLTVGATSVPAVAAPPSCGRVQVGLDVANTSAVDGDEVVQLYVAYPASNAADLARPRQQLRGFRRVHIAAGATAHVTFDIGTADLTYYDAANARLAVEAGTSVELQVGASSRDIRLRAPLAIAP